MVCSTDGTLRHAGRPAPRVVEADWRNMRLFDDFWVQQCHHCPPTDFDNALLSEAEEEEEEDQDEADDDDDDDDAEDDGQEV